MLTTRVDAWPAEGARSLLAACLNPGENRIRCEGTAIAAHLGVGSFRCLRNRSRSSCSSFPACWQRAWVRSSRHISPRAPLHRRRPSPPSRLPRYHHNPLWLLDLQPHPLRRASRRTGRRHWPSRLPAHPRQANGAPVRTQRRGGRARRAHRSVRRTGHSPPYRRTPSLTFRGPRLRRHRRLGRRRR